MGEMYRQRVGKDSYKIGEDEKSINERMKSLVY